ncbi:MAG: DUF4908 domain-containing protein [Pseudomonadota bacterium]
MVGMDTHFSDRPRWRAVKTIAGLPVAIIAALALPGHGLAQASPDGQHAYPRTGSIVRDARFEQDNPFNSLVGKKRVRARQDRTSGRVERFVLSGGDQAFLFQVIGDRAYIQFQCSADDPRVDCQIDPGSSAPEIHVLLPIRAPRGDIIYKNRQGETVLRMASYGGATVWWPGAKTAEPASRSYSDLSRLDHGPASGTMVINRANRASAILSAMTGEPIIFNAGMIGAVSKGGPQPARRGEYASEDTQASAARDSERRTQRHKKRREARRTATLNQGAGQRRADTHGSDTDSAMSPAMRRQLDGLADAIVVTAVGIGRVAADATGARVIANRISMVNFEVMPAAPGGASDAVSVPAAVSLDKTVLTVRYRPGMPLDRRLSSADVAGFLEDNL